MTDKFDGLYDPEEPCGCLYDDAAPCGIPGDERDCKPGYRVDYKATEQCGCEGQGTNHWHIQPVKEKE